jgi:hypothetical protein
MSPGGERGVIFYKVLYNFRYDSSFQIIELTRSMEIVFAKQI